MAEVASAYVALLPSARGWEREVGRQIDGSTTKAGKAAGTKSGRAFSGAFSGAVKGVLAAAGGIAITRVATDFIGDSISGASDLNETLSKSRVIFGANAKAIDKWAKSADKALGLSEQAALESAASFGDMFSQIGLGERRATKMSKAVVKMAADLGSFNNLSTEDVLERIAGGFRGEYDALQKVIPNISAARVQQEALNRTHKKAVSELTAAEKAEATLAIIRKDGARAVGDFSRTSDGLANSQKILAARTDNLKAAIGQGLIPVTTDIVNKTSDFVEGMQDGTGAGGQFVDVLEDARDVGKGVLAFFDSIPGPVKKYGAELLIAGVALNKINSGLITGKANITGWLNSLGPAEAKMTRVSRASYALGVGLRNLAGAGGMIAVVKSTHETNLAVAGLERTLGGAAAGFAVGGPIGGAIGGLGGLFTTAWQAIRATGKENKVTLPTFREYETTLDGVAAATTRVTREMAFQRLEQAGLLGATRELGLTDREAVQAVLGNVDARTKLANALIGNTQISGAQRRALEQETGALGASRLAQLKKNVAIAGSAEELRKAKKALHDFMAEPASKRVSIVGVEEATAKLRALRAGLKEALGLTKDLNTAGPGGLDVLLGAPLKPRKRRALGGPISPNEPYIINERGPEIFTSSQRGRLTPLSQIAQGSSSSPGPQFNVENVYAQDVNDFLRQMQTRARHSALDGIPR